MSDIKQCYTEQQVAELIMKGIADADLAAWPQVAMFSRLAKPVALARESDVIFWAAPPLRQSYPSILRDLMNFISVFCFHPQPRPVRLISDRA